MLHVVHEDDPLMLEAVPAEQGVHVDEPVVEYEPALHVSHDSDSIWLILPASQTTHSVFAFFTWYPATHAVQVVLPVSE